MDLNQTNSNILVGNFRSRERSELPTATAKTGAIEFAMRSKLASLKGTQYVDTFDWSIYDKIAARYGNNQPRGGVVFKTTFKLVNEHESCRKCHYAFELDSYGRGCVHDCLYCYAKEQLSSHGYWNRPTPFPVDLSEIRKIFYTIFETDKHSPWRAVMEKKVPLRIGSMSDSFMWMDLKFGISRELIKILNFYKYPHIVFTRSDLIAHEKYLPLLDPNLATVQFSICGNNESLTKAIEPGAPSVERRLKALRKLSDAGIWTAVRMNPLFPLFPDGYFSDPRGTKMRFKSEEIPNFPIYDETFFEQVRDAKVKTLLAGFVRLSPHSIKAISRASGIDLSQFFKPENLVGYKDRHYSDEEIAHYYQEIEKACSSRGIRFSTCYIGNGEKDYHSYQDLWANKKDCCDVVGNLSSFGTTCQAIQPSSVKKPTKPCSKSKGQPNVLH